MLQHKPNSIFEAARKVLERSQVQLKEGSFDKADEIKSLEDLIKNPDPKRVEEYGGTKYVDMLRAKLDKLTNESSNLKEVVKNNRPRSKPSIPDPDGKLHFNQGQTWWWKLNQGAIKTTWSAVEKAIANDKNIRSHGEHNEDDGYMQKVMGFIDYRILWKDSSELQIKISLDDKGNKTDEARIDVHHESWWMRFAVKDRARPYGTLLPPKDKLNWSEDDIVLAEASKAPDVKDYYDDQEDISKQWPISARKQLKFEKQKKGSVELIIVKAPSGQELERYQLVPGTGWMQLK